VHRDFRAVDSLFLDASALPFNSSQLSLTKQQINANMEPIPLRTLTVLLNYERMISDPRFEGVALHSSSIVDHSMIPNVRRNYPYVFANEPATIEYTFSYQSIVKGIPRFAKAIIYLQREKVQRFPKRHSAPNFRNSFNHLFYSPRCRSWSQSTHVCPARTHLS
jgi:hypothetical protein